MTDKKEKLETKKLLYDSLVGFHHDILFKAKFL